MGSKSNGYTLDSVGTDLAAAFDAVMALQSAPRKAKHVIDDEVFVEMCFRMIRALERRAIDNPAILPLVEQLSARLSEITNVALAHNALRFRIDPMNGASLGEGAAMLGISKPSASVRASRGLAAMVARVEAAGDTRFAERYRERLAILAARSTSVVVLADFRQRRAVTTGAERKVA